MLRKTKKVPASIPKIYVSDLQDFSKCSSKTDKPGKNQNGGGKTKRSRRQGCSEAGATAGRKRCWQVGRTGRFSFHERQIYNTFC